MGIVLSLWIKLRELTFDNIVSLSADIKYMAIYSFFSGIFHQSVVVFFHVVLLHSWLDLSVRFILGNANVDDIVFLTSDSTFC